jgi:hypothetical protein
MTATESAADNGVNVQALLEARAALTDAPEAAEFTWRATTEWVRGTHSQSTIDGYSGLGADHVHKSTFSYSADHPEVFASEDNGPTPVEFVLVGLAQLPHCRRRRSGAEPQHPAAFGEGHDRG